MFIVKKTSATMNLIISKRESLFYTTISKQRE